MELNELINKYSIDEISKKTRIAPDNLEAIFRQDWAYLKKVQALGFLSILEREYGVDVSTLRQECRNYFDSYDSNEDYIAINANQDDTLEDKPKYLIKGIFFIFLALLAYGSWYLFVDKNESLESNNTAPRKESLYESVVHLASNWLNPVESEAQVETVEEKNSSTLKDSSIESNQTEDSIAQKKTQEESNTQKESNQTAQQVYSKDSINSQDEQIIANVKQEQAQAEEQNAKEQESATNQDTQDNEDIIVEDTQSDNQNSEDTILDTQTKESDTQAQEDIQEPLSPTPPSIEKILPKDDTQKESKKINEKEAKKESIQKEQKRAKEETKATGYKVIIFQPLKKVWLGYTNLTNMKRVAEVTKDSVEFDTSNTSYILATGHGVLQFVDKKGNVLLKMRNGKKNFFLIDNSGVKEISHEEFQRLNKSKVW